MVLKGLLVSELDRYDCRRVFIKLIPGAATLRCFFAEVVEQTIE